VVHDIITHNIKLYKLYKLYLKVKSLYVLILNLSLKVYILFNVSYIKSFNIDLKLNYLDSETKIEKN